MADHKVATLYPADLPEKPTGWTRKMLTHMNFGRDGGAATFSVFDDKGMEMPIGYQYDTRKGGMTGFSLENIEGVMNWAALRAAWPEWIKTRGREGP